jgi:hypothetical protein
MHQHTQLNSFEDPQEVSTEVQQTLEAKNVKNSQIARTG